VDEQRGREELRRVGGEAVDEGRGGWVVRWIAGEAVVLRVSAIWKSTG
jgi:hypothetical protein